MSDKPRHLFKESLPTEQLKEMDLLHCDHVLCKCPGCRTHKEATAFLRSVNTKSSYDVYQKQDAQDVALVASQAQTSPDVAIRALKEAGSDLVEAIMLIRDGKVK